MNKERRKSLREIQSKLERLGEDLEALKEEEEEYRDNMPENLQESDTSEQMKFAIYCRKHSKTWIMRTSKSRRLSNAEKRV